MSYLFPFLHSLLVIKTISSGNRSQEFFLLNSASDYNVTVEELRLAYRNVIIVSDSPPSLQASQTWEKFQKRLTTTSMPCDFMCDNDSLGKV